MNREQFRIADDMAEFGQFRTRLAASKREPDVVQTTPPAAQPPEERKLHEFSRWDYDDS